MSFAERLVLLREQKGLTQAELAKKLSISRSALSLWEISKREPDYKTLEKIASLFGVSVDYLLGHDSAPDNPPDEVDQLVEHLHKRPELKMLFSKSKNATKEDIEKAVSYIEFLKKQSEGDFDE